MASTDLRPVLSVSDGMRDRIRGFIVKFAADSRMCELSEVEKDPRIADDLDGDSISLLALCLGLEREVGVRVHFMDELRLFVGSEHYRGTPSPEVESRLTAMFAELGLPIPDFSGVKSVRDLLTVDVMTRLVVRNMKDGEEAADLRRTANNRFRERWGPFATVVRDLQGIAEICTGVWSAITRCWRR